MKGMEITGLADVPPVTLFTAIMAHMKELIRQYQKSKKIARDFIGLPIAFHHSSVFTATTEAGGPVSVILERWNQMGMVHPGEKNQGKKPVRNFTANITTI